MTKNKTDIKKFRNTSDAWKHIEEEAIKTVSKQMNIKESRVRLDMEQSKQRTALGYCLKHVRQKKRISVKKMAEKLKATENIIKNIESKKISNFPLGAIITYFNELGCILTFKVVDCSRGNYKELNGLDLLDFV